ncbi:MAG TPA: 2-C-methyl-D-erythritol 4-phosphate cytidylyltransferase, partial [Ignavibacteriales bacterium]|nr:2-C-methyl-D-erythritol 4-phosphate cytidylyltransferase [Ignavibacteriales bacterium]
SAGSGKRFGGSLPKQYTLIDGIPVIIRTLHAFQDIEAVTAFVIPINPEWESYLSKLLEEYNIIKPVLFTPGGRERQDSVCRAIEAANTLKPGIILVHDAVRPFVSKELVLSVIDNAGRYGAAIPALPARDTIKRKDNNGFVIETLNRSELIAVQTPQGFRTDLLIKAYDIASQKNIYSTDDAALAEMAGIPIKIVAGEDTNIKITTPTDTVTALAILGARP